MSSLTHDPAWDALIAAAHAWGAPWPDLREITRELHNDNTVTVPRPRAYDVDQLRQLHHQEPTLARAVARKAGGWSVCPRNDAEFVDVLDLWEHGHDPTDLDDDHGHFVSVAHCTFGRASNEITVALCKDCGIPVWARGIAYRFDHDPEASCAWRAIWPPQAGTRPSGAAASRVCRIPDCDQEIYLRPDSRDTCEGCRLRHGLRPHPLDLTPPNAVTKETD